MQNEWQKVINLLWISFPTTSALLCPNLPISFFKNEFCCCNLSLFPELFEETQSGEASGLIMPPPVSNFKEQQEIGNLRQWRNYSCIIRFSIFDKKFTMVAIETQEHHFGCGAPRPGLCRRCRWCSMASNPPPVLLHTSGGADLGRCAHGAQE